MNTLTQATISSLHTLTSTMPLQGISQIQRCDLQSYESYCGVQGKGLGDGTNPLRGCLGKNQRCRKGKISDYREKQAWESQGYCDKKDRSPASRLHPAVPCLSYQTNYLLLQLFLGPPFASHVHLQDMESDHRSQGLLGLWCQQSRVWASAGLGVITRSTGLDWPANPQSGFRTGTGDTDWSSWGSWLLKEQGGAQGKLLDYLWSLELAAEHVHMCKRQWAINRPKSSRVEWVPKPSTLERLNIYIYYILYAYIYVCRHSAWSSRKSNSMRPLLLFMLALVPSPVLWGQIIYIHAEYLCLFAENTCLASQFTEATDT